MQLGDIIMNDTQILVVEDERIVASDIEKRLIKRGYQVSGIVGSGEEAVAKAQDESPDLVLMDIVLKGGMDGISAAKKIHAHFNIPVIFITAYADQETLAKAKKSEPYGYLIKPFEEGELIAAVEIALERHKSVSRLKEKEKHFRFLIENGSDIILVIDKNGDFEYGSPSITNILGYEPAEYLGKRGRDFIHPKDLPQVKTFIESRRQIPGTAPAFELRARHKDGTWRNLEAIAKNLLADPEVEGFVINARDITERKSAEADLNKAHQELKAIFEALPDLFFLLDVNGTVLDYNAGKISELLIPPEKFLGKRIKEVMPEPAASILVKALSEVREKGRLVVSEYFLPTNNGYNFYEARLLPLSTGQIIAIARNITDRKKSEEKEKKYARNLDFLSKTAMDLVRISPDKDLFQYIAEKAKAIAGEATVIVSSYNEVNDTLEVKHIHGIEKHYHDILKLIKADPVGMVFKINPEAKQAYLSGKVVNAPISLYELTFRKLSKKVCGKLESLVGIRNIFTVGLCHSEALFGNVAILAHKRDPALDVNLIETFANQAAVALQRRKAEEQLKYLSLHDPLTGLYNRTFFEEEMHRLDIDRVDSVGMIMCDVDGLKLVNDIMGHKTGDGLLMAISGIIRDACRKGDLVARLGGDEFAVLLPSISKPDLDGICQRIKTTIHNYNAENPELPLSMSIGQTMRSKNDQSVMDLFKEADNIMYRQKLDNHDILIQNFIKALKTRGVISEGRIARLENLMTHFAMTMGLSEIDIKELKLLARFCDIGKIGVPGRILLKSSALDPHEMAEMKRHCEIGYHVALFAPDLIPVADLILKHHEWWNGQGYPLGLAGGDIPLECRMLAVAKAYEAMTRERPYSKALNHEEAIEELNRSSGTQFDPFLVEKFIGMF
jgi:diguanylate cyclase (GGDEF)-like protein/PAS domain S-box-containing protein